MQIYPQLARRFDLPVSKGAWVQEVVPGGPADEAGLRAGTDSERFQARTVNDGGDIITAVDGRALADEARSGSRCCACAPAQEVVLRVYRDGRPRNVRVTLGTRPQQTGNAVLP